MRSSVDGKWSIVNWRYVSICVWYQLLVCRLIILFLWLSNSDKTGIGIEINGKVQGISMYLPYMMMHWLSPK